MLQHAAKAQELGDRKRSKRAVLFRAQMAHEPPGPARGVRHDGAGPLVGPRVARGVPNPVRTEERRVWPGGIAVQRRYHARAMRSQNQRPW